MPMGQSGGPLGGGGGPGGGGFPDGPGGGPGGLSLDGGDEDGDGPGPHRRRKTDKTDKPDKTPEKGQGRKQVKDAKTPAKGQSRKEVKDAKTTTKDGKTKDGKKKDAKKTDAMHKKVVKARKVETKAPIKAPMKAKGKWGRRQHTKEQQQRFNTDRVACPVQLLTDRTCAPVRVDFGSMNGWLTMNQWSCWKIEVEKTLPSEVAAIVGFILRFQDNNINLTYTNNTVHVKWRTLPDQAQQSCWASSG